MNGNADNKINENNANYAVKSNVIRKNADVKENYIAGLIGAFIFSLAGGVVWYLLYQIGYVAGISGFVGVVCAIKGYALFGKKESVKGVVSAVIIATLVMVLAWYLCLATDIYKAHKEWNTGGAMAPFTEYIRDAYTVLEDGETAAAAFGNLALGLLFCVIGGFGAVRQAVARVKQENEVKIVLENTSPENTSPENTVPAEESVETTAE